MRTHHDRPAETTIQSSYRGSMGDFVISFAAILGLLAFCAWQLKVLFGS
jgi:hypothetical protein